MDITIFTFELGSLQSHHLPSIMCRWEITFSWASYSVNLTKPNPLEFPVLASLFTWVEEQMSHYEEEFTKSIYCFFLSYVTSFYLNHNDFTKCAKVVFKVLFSCFPRKTQNNQVRGLHVTSLHFYSRGCINFLHFSFVVWRIIWRRYSMFNSKTATAQLN